MASIVSRKKKKAEENLTDEQKKARRDARREARRAARRMPDSIKNNRFLDEAISKALPSNYNFEIK